MMEQLSTHSIIEYEGSPEHMAEETRTVLTPEGLAKLNERLDYLAGTRLNEIAQQIEIARGFGDLSENAEYDEAKKEQGRVAEEIARIQEKLRTAEIIDTDALGTDVVTIGCKVKVKNADTGDTITYTIVGAEEADPFEGRISNESPVGKALLGAKKNATVQVNIPKGVLTYKIMSIKR